MRRLTIVVLFAFMLFAFGTAARANIVSLSCSGDMNGNTTWGSIAWGGTDTANGWVHIAGTQSTAGSGTTVTTISTDTISDPTLSYTDTATNTGSSSWSGYNVWVIIATPGTISAPTLSGENVITPSSGWSATPNTPSSLTYAGTGTGFPFPFGWSLYEGNFSMTGSPPIPDTGPNNNLVFGYSVNFGGSDQYEAYQIQSPAFTPVPEPGTMALLAGGGGMVLWRMRRRRVR
jgi:hypothetical protein